METVTPRQLLRKFYDENRFGPDGGNSNPHVKIELARWLHIYVPNFDARRKVVQLHDIHHLLTGYTTSLPDECAISAWEIGSGCKHYWVGYLFNTSAVMLGVLVNPLGIVRGFARGRRCRNLYYDLLPVETVLDMPVPELQQLLGLDRAGAKQRAGFPDVVLLLAFLAFGVVFSILIGLLMPLVLLYTLYVLAWGRARG